MTTELTNEKKVYDVLLAGTGVKMKGECTKNDAGLQKANLTVHAVSDPDSGSAPGMPGTNKGTISYSKNNDGAVTQSLNSVQADLSAEATTMFLQFVSEQNGVSTTVTEEEA